MHGDIRVYSEISGHPCPFRDDRSPSRCPPQFLNQLSSRVRDVGPRTGHEIVKQTRNRNDHLFRIRLSFVVHRPPPPPPCKGFACPFVLTLAYKLRRAFKMCIGRKIGTTRSKINQNCPEFKEQPRKKLVGASPHTYEDGKFGGSFVFKKSWNAVGRQFSVELETL